MTPCAQRAQCLMYNTCQFDCVITCANQGCMENHSACASYMFTTFHFSFTFCTMSLLPAVRFLNSFSSLSHKYKYIKKKYILHVGTIKYNKIQGMITIMFMFKRHKQMRVSIVFILLRQRGRDHNAQVRYTSYRQVENQQKTQQKKGWGILS